MHQVQALPAWLPGSPEGAIQDGAVQVDAVQYATVHQDGAVKSDAV